MDLQQSEDTLKAKLASAHAAIRELTLALTNAEAEIDSLNAIIEAFTND